MTFKKKHGGHLQTSAMSPMKPTIVQLYIENQTRIIFPELHRLKLFVKFHPEKTTQL